jgi:alpha-1,3-mannosyl-glycoprotein beta-1,2-N-acetylglucosaminyltransferase
MGCPVIISQDGRDEGVAKVAADFKEKLNQVGVPLIHMQHERGSSNLRGVSPSQAYEALARHYGWGLTRLFSGAAYPVQQTLWPIPDRVIILEEDLHIAIDFFDYFNATAPLLDNDPTLLAISAFNDNGKRDKVVNETRLLRSDFFPGLGWMMTRKLWQNELSIKWPKVYWDDWLREPQQRQGRHIIRPEVSRTFHFGTEGGASGNQFGAHHSDILLNSKPVDWNSLQSGFSTLLALDQFDRDYGNVVSQAKLAPEFSSALELARQQSVRLEYSSLAEFQRLARALKLMDDEKAGVPRTAYRGVVETRPHGNQLLFLTPPLERLKQDFKLV